MRMISTSKLISALNAEMANIRRAGGLHQSGRVSELSIAQVEDNCELFCAVKAIKESYAETVSISWIYGSGLGYVFQKARQGERSAQRVADVINEFLKKEKRK